mmetsp:Transcript_2026/g.7228  ORF Transcript_2026/g.7228 Transcript_2026/m.7228 type:complete len:356 (-) Transcript_2026:48-1115(-)
MTPPLPTVSSCSSCSPSTISLVVDVAKLAAAISSSGLPSLVFPMLLYTLIATLNPSISPRYTVPLAPLPNFFPSSTPKSSKLTTRLTARVPLSIAFAAAFSVHGFAANANHASFGNRYKNSGNTSIRLSLALNNSKFTNSLIKVGNSLILFPANINFLIFRHFPKLFGNTSISLSLRINHPKDAIGNDCSGISRTLFALNESMNKCSISPRTSGTFLNSFARQNKIFRFGKSFANESGSAFNLFFPRLRNSRFRNRKTSFGTARKPHSLKSKRVCLSLSDSFIERRWSRIFAHFCCASSSSLLLLFVVVILSKEEKTDDKDDEKNATETRTRTKKRSTPSVFLRVAVVFHLLLLL